MSGMAKVLVVEDEFAIADLLEAVLTDEGYSVVLAGDGRQGLDRLAEGPLPDLVISDYMMPVLDGIGLIRAMQASEAQRGIPYIVMNAMPEANIRGRFEGCAAFVHKPFKLAALVRLVASILDERNTEPQPDVIMPGAGLPASVLGLLASPTAVADGSGIDGQRHSEPRC
jgi:CheY-like chemotaxis protein